ncbi:MAG: hypothetical protein K2Y23_03490 [Cyanobacteria bacterium]|nr:hypothetical protein [Cyanobacteriota bacterium]
MKPHTVIRILFCSMSLAVAACGGSSSNASPTSPTPNDIDAGSVTGA